MKDYRIIADFKDALPYGGSDLRGIFAYLEKIEERDIVEEVKTLGSIEDIIKGGKKGAKNIAKTFLSRFMEPPAIDPEYLESSNTQTQRYNSSREDSPIITLFSNTKTIKGIRDKIKRVESPPSLDKSFKEGRIDIENPESSYWQDERGIFRYTMGDIHRLRLVCRDENDIYKKVLPFIDDNFEVRRRKDFFFDTRFQKPNNYGAVHDWLVVGPEKQLVEVQYRTVESHHEAEEGRASDYYTKRDLL